MANKRSLKSKKGAGKEIPVQIVPTVSDATPFFYCNYVSVSQTPYDFVFTLVKLPVLLTDSQRESVQKDRRLSVEASMQIAISPRLMPELIDAFSEQKRKYEEQFGPIKRSDADGHK